MIAGMKLSKSERIIPRIIKIKDTHFLILLAVLSFIAYAMNVREAAI